MGKNKVPQITIKTERKPHLHTCKVCKSDDVTVSSRYVMRGKTAGQGIAKCEDCKSVVEF